MLNGAGVFRCPAQVSVHSLPQVGGHKHSNEQNDLYMDMRAHTHCLIITIFSPLEQFIICTWLLNTKLNAYSKLLSEQEMWGKELFLGMVQMKPQLQHIGIFKWMVLSCQESENLLLAYKCRSSSCTKAPENLLHCLWHSAADWPPVAYCHTARSSLFPAVSLWLAESFRKQVDMP